MAGRQLAEERANPLTGQGFLDFADLAGRPWKGAVAVTVGFEPTIPFRV